MGLRKGRCYSKLKRPYTRKSKVRNKNYIKTTPQSKIAKFAMGNVTAFLNKKYKYTLSLIALEPIQIRDNALEASRQLILRHLEKKLKTEFYLALMAYPHNVLRENKMLTGAGADRMQTGMQLSFGKAIGVAARIHKKEKIFMAACNKESLPFVRGVMEKAKSKLPGKKAIIVEKLE